MATAGSILYLIDVPIRPALIAGVRERADEFWRRIATHDPYPPDYGRDAGTIAALYSDDDGGMAELSGDAAARAIEVLEARATLKAREKDGTEAVKERKALDAELVHLLGNATSAMLPDGTIFSARTIRKDSVHRVGASIPTGDSKQGVQHVVEASEVVAAGVGHNLPRMDHSEMERAEARALGLLRYCTGRICRNGHMADRRTNNGRCVECARQAACSFREKHKAAIAERDRQYYVKNAERIKARVLNAYNEDPKRTLDRVKTWYVDNRDDNDFKQKRNALTRNRRARLRSIDGKHSKDDIARIRGMQNDRCAYCRRPLKGKGPVDHIVSLKAGGTNWPRNLQLVCAHCNQTKSARDSIDFAHSIGNLFDRNNPRPDITILRA